MAGTDAESRIDADLLRLLPQALAACDHPDIRAVVRQEWTDLHRAVANRSGSDHAALQEWFARGMLLTVSAAMDA